MTAFSQVLASTRLPMGISAWLSPMPTRRDLTDGEVQPVIPTGLTSSLQALLSVCSTVGREGKQILAEFLLALKDEVAMRRWR